jgi:peptidoglycan-associated lipoprotein
MVRVDGFALPPRTRGGAFAELLSMMRFSTVLKLAALSGVLALAGCETKPAMTQDNTPPTSMSSTGPSGNVVPGSAEDLKVNAGDTVHFDYNAFNVRDADRAILQRQAAWLQKYPQVRVTVEGHCDERGTREYNLALGARRANAVKEYLVSLGVSAGRVDTVSYGKERPMCIESEDSCWAQNRRGVTAITAGASS